MVCQPSCALTIRIVEKYFSEPVSLLKTGRMLMALASLPCGTPALCRHVGLRPTPEGETQHLRARWWHVARASWGKPNCFPEPHLSCIGQSGPGLPLLSALPRDSLICSHRFSNPTHADRPDLSSDTLPASLVQPSATPRTAQN